MEIIKPSPKAVTKAAVALNKGGVVICPTDTVYGFLAAATNKKAVEKIYRIKKRPRLKPLPLFVYSIKKAKELAEIDDRQERILKQKWPGRYTFVLESKIQNPKIKIYGVDKETIAIRIPKHKFLLSLLKKANRPLIQTSVNISGQPEINKMEEIIKIPGIDLIIDAGNLQKSKPSTIIDLSKNKNKILRK